MEFGTEWKEKKRRWIFTDFIRKGLRYSLALTLVIFAIYTVGSIPDPGFSDRLLFLFLRLLQYSSLILCAFSLFAMGYSVRRMVNHPSLRNALGMALYFLATLFGAGLAMLNSLIFIMSEGIG